MFDHTGTDNDTAAGFRLGFILYENINCSGSAHDPNSTHDDIAWIEENSEYVDIVVHILGFLGNVLSLTILFRRRIGGQEMCRLLLLLSVAEVLYTLLSFLPETVELFTQHSTRLWLKIFCKVAGHTFLSLRNWWIASIGCARFFVIWKPLRMKRMNVYKPTGITIVFVVLFVVWLAESIALTFAFKVRVRHCLSSHTSYIDVWYMHDDSFSLKLLEGFTLFMRTVLPVVLVSIFSCLTVRQIGLSLELQNRAANGNGSFKQKKNNRYSSATKTILGLTVAFAVFELPLAFTFIFCFLDFSKDMDAYRALEIYNIISELLVSFDSLCNVFIYCLSSKIYRDEIKHLLCCRRRRSLTRELTQTDAPHHFTRGRLRNRLTVGEIDGRKISDSSNIIVNSNCNLATGSDIGQIHLEEDTY